MSKYQPLADHLKGLESNEVELTFSEVESIIGFRLPQSARDHNAWWANSKTNDTHSWAHRWIEAGWEVKVLKIEEQKVIYQRSKKIEYLDISSKEAIEGYEYDSRILARHRNADLARKRRILDGYRCQACSFKLKLNGNYVIEVHHLEPLSISGETVNSLDDLVSLCPTCHRISHLKKDRPFTIDEISEIVKMG